MRTIEVSYTATYYVDVPDSWEITEEQGDQIIRMAIEQHEDNPDGTWEIVGELSKLSECPECGEMSDDFRGDWCKDCDKQGGAN